MKHWPIRVRLVAGFSVAMLVVLVASAVFVYWRVEYALDRGLDGDLDRATTALEQAVGPDGSITDDDAVGAAERDRDDGAAPGAGLVPVAHPEDHDVDAVLGGPADDAGDVRRAGGPDHRDHPPQGPNRQRRVDGELRRRVGAVRRVDGPVDDRVERQDRLGRPAGAARPSGAGGTTGVADAASAGAASGRVVISNASSRKRGIIAPHYTISTPPCTT